jgi:hypothetical protein
MLFSAYLRPIISRQWTTLKTQQRGHTTDKEYFRLKETKGMLWDYFLDQGIKVGMNTQSVMEKLLAKIIFRNKHIIFV